MRYYNKTENKYYYVGQPMTHRLSETSVWAGTNPTPEQLAEWGYTEVVEPVYEPTPIPIEQQYKDLVISKIRLQYSTDDELAIQRQRATKPEEFATYNAYCEQCKADARKELNYNESQEE